jgi:predicted membrane protein
MAPLRRRVPLDAQVALTAVLLGIGNGMLHWQSVDRSWRDYQADEHVRIIAGNFIDPDQYRILTYALAEGLVRLGLPIHSAHEVWRVIFTSLSLFVFYRYARGWFSPMVSIIGMFMLAAAIPLTYIYYMMQVADPLNMLVFFVAFWLIREERDIWLLPLIGVGMLNRESPAVIPVFYAAIRWGRPWREWVPITLATLLLAIAVYEGLRLAYGPRPYCCTDGPLQKLIINFTDWRAYVDVLGVLNIALWGGWIGWRRRPEFLRRAALMIPVFIVPYLLFGTVRESRYYLPILAILIPMVLFYLGEVIREEASSTVEVDKALERSAPLTMVTAATVPARISK